MLRAAASGVARRRVQTAVLFVVLLAASASATLGLTLYTSASEGFREEFAKYHGANLAVYVDAKRATVQELENTARLPEVTDAAGPYPATTVTIGWTASTQGSRRTGPQAGPGAPTSQALTIAGRASLSGPLDDLTRSGGRWPASPDEIATADYDADLGGFPIGSTMTVHGLAGRPRLLVVGNGGSAARQEAAWMTPAESPRW